MRRPMLGKTARLVTCRTWFHEPRWWPPSGRHHEVEAEEFRRCATPLHIERAAPYKTSGAGASSAVTAEPAPLSVTHGTRPGNRRRPSKSEREWEPECDPGHRFLSETASDRGRTGGLGPASFSGPWHSDGVLKPARHRRSRALCYRPQASARRRSGRTAEDLARWRRTANPWRA